MGRHKKKKDDGLEGGRLKEETLSLIFGIGFFVVSVFFMLAAWQKAGVVGRKIYGNEGLLSALFGFGYFLIPAVSLMLGISFIKSLKQSFGKIKLLGALLFFVSALAIIGLVSQDSGGIIGNLLHKPMVRLFDVYATSVILGALALIGALIMLDGTLTFSFLGRLFNKKAGEQGEDKEEKEAKIIGADLKEDEERKSAAATLSKNFNPKTSEESELGILKSGILLKPYTPPPLSLLEYDRGKPEVGDIKANANIIKRTLQNFGIIVEMDEISIGPSVTRYALKPAEGVKLSRILGLQNNLELALAAHPVRIEAPIPGKSLVGIEIPNVTKIIVGLASLLSQRDYTDSPQPLIVSLGKSISGGAVFANLSKMPHLLIAGATGSGKSVTIHAIINSLLFRNSPENLKFIMIDPKRVELTLYNNIPHLLTPVITEPKKVILSLKWAAKEMERRYDILERHKVRDVESYHRNVLSPKLEKIKKEKKPDPGEMPDLVPYIVIIIDELADIMQTYPRELESAVIRLAQMSRAVGIHLILSTQRPSVNVITGLIKANIPSRIALQVASQFDSRTILDCAGAEKLLGAGDMLYLSGEMSKPVRLQSPFISESEVKKVVDYLIKNAVDEVPAAINIETEPSKNAIFESMKDAGEPDDDLYEEAREVVILAGKASTSYLQRKLRVGYARAARLMDILEENGVISEGEGAKPREVLVKPEGSFSAGEADENKEKDNGLL